MAGVIPMSRPPAYAAPFVEMMQGIDLGAQKRLASELEARSANLGHILSNIKDIAAVGGSGTLDPLLGAHAGAKGDPVFGNEYAGMMDRLRAELMQSEIGVNNRSPAQKGGSGDNALVAAINQIGKAYSSGPNVELDAVWVQEFGPDNKPIGKKYPVSRDEFIESRRGGMNLKQVNPTTITGGIGTSTTEAYDPIVHSDEGGESVPPPPFPEGDMVQGVLDAQPNPPTNVPGGAPAQPAPQSGNVAGSGSTGPASAPPGDEGAAQYMADPRVQTATRLSGGQYLVKLKDGTELVMD